MQVVPTYHIHDPRFWVEYIQKDVVHPLVATLSMVYEKVDGEVKEYKIQIDSVTQRSWCRREEKEKPFTGIMDSDAEYYVLAFDYTESQERAVPVIKKFIISRILEVTHIETQPRIPSHE